MPPTPFRKHDPQAAEDFYRTEAAGLRWLGEATAAGGVAVAEVIEVTATSITLPRYPNGPATAQQAAEFGHRLALTHATGAPHHGAPPAGLAPDADGFIAALPMAHLSVPPPHWGDFYARCRLAPFARTAHHRGSIDDSGLADLLRLCERLCADDQDLTGPPVPPARLHGDLWSGNVLWTPQGARLIDPAAHGGHPETDLAMLSLFGQAHLDVILDAYTRTTPLPDGRRERAPLHELHPLLVHAVLFGSSYGHQAVQVARGLLAR